MESEPTSAPTTSRYARLVVRLRFVIPVLWIVGAVLAVTMLPTIEQAQTGGLGDLVPKDAQSIKVEQRAAEQFGFPLLSRTVVVQRRAAGLSPLAQARVAQRAVAITRHRVPNLARVAAALPLVNVAGVTPFARERSTTALTYLFFRPDVSSQDRGIYATRLRDAIRAGEPRQYVGVTGALAARSDQAHAVERALPFVELMTILLVGLVVGLHFRAPPAPLMTLLAIGISYLIALRVMAAIGQRLGISVPSEVQPVVVVLLFGIVTDYAIFFMSRFRQRLAEGQAPLRAAESATAELQGIVLTAALIVAAGSASLIVAKLGFFQAFGPGMALAVVVGAAVSLTFIPACLALFGTALFWPSRPGRELSAAAAAEEPDPERHERVGRTGAVGLAARRPLLVVVCTSIVLLTAASGLSRIDLGQPLIRGLPAGTEARVAYNAAAAGFAPGILSPTMIVVEQRDIAQRRAALRSLQGRLQARGGIAQVIGPRQQPVDRTFGAVYAADGNAARFLIVFRSDPLGARAINQVTGLRKDLPGLLRASGLPAATAGIAGDTSLAEETVVDARGDIGRVAPAVLLVVFVLLAIFLRALVAPLYLVLSSVLALSAALGTTVYVLGLFGQNELTYFVPFAAAVLLVPLGSDYNVFLSGRIWSEARVRPLRDAVRIGGSRAATAITIAGVVLALSFGLLAVVPLRAFRELALAMFAGLLIDAFVVRTLLVPALIALIGEKSAWPSRLRQMPTGPGSRAAGPPAPVERKL